MNLSLGEICLSVSPCNKAAGKLYRDRTPALFSFCSLANNYLYRDNFTLLDSKSRHLTRRVILFTWCSDNYSQMKVVLPKLPALKHLVYCNAVKRYAHKIATKHTPSSPREGKLTANMVR